MGNLTLKYQGLFVIAVEAKEYWHPSYSKIVDANLQATLRTFKQLLAFRIVTALWNFYCSFNRCFSELDKMKTKTKLKKLATECYPQWE